MIRKSTFKTWSMTMLGIVIILFAAAFGTIATSMAFADDLVAAETAELMLQSPAQPDQQAQLPEITANSEQDSLPSDIDTSTFPSVSIIDVGADIVDAWPRMDLTSKIISVILALLLVMPIVSTRIPKDVSPWLRNSIPVIGVFADVLLNILSARYGHDAVTKVKTWK